MCGGARRDGPAAGRPREVPEPRGAGGRRQRLPAWQERGVLRGATSARREEGAIGVGWQARSARGRRDCCGRVRCPADGARLRALPPQPSLAEPGALAAGS